MYFTAIVINNTIRKQGNMATRLWRLHVSVPDGHCGGLTHAHMARSSIPPAGLPAQNKRDGVQLSKARSKWALVCLGTTFSNQSMTLNPSGKSKGTCLCKSHERRRIVYHRDLDILASGQRVASFPAVLLTKLTCLLRSTFPTVTFSDWVVYYVVAL